MVDDILPYLSVSNTGFYSSRLKMLIVQATCFALSVLLLHMIGMRFACVIWIPDAKSNRQVVEIFLYLKGAKIHFLTNADYRDNTVGHY